MLVCAGFVTCTFIGLHLERKETRMFVDVLLFAVVESGGVSGSGSVCNGAALGRVE